MEQVFVGVMCFPLSSRCCCKSIIPATMFLIYDFCLIGIMVSSISLDENSLHWTDGSVIASVGLADPNNTPNVSTSFGDVAIISLHTLSPGQQPQYCKFHVNFNIIVTQVSDMLLDIYRCHNPSLFAILHLYLASLLILGALAIKKVLVR